MPCLYSFLLFISCLLIYMLNYLLFFSMVHEYAYFYEYIWKLHVACGTVSETLKHMYAP